MYRIAAAALFLLAVAPAAQASEEEAETCLRAKVWDGYSQGWGIRTLTSMSLNPGMTRNLVVTLYKGNEYQIRTCGDGQVKNLDLFLYDAAGNVVKRDDTVDREPMISLKPEATATYYIVVHAKELVGADPAGLSVAVTYK